SSVHRHKTNCLKLGSSNDIKKEAARGSAAVALLPSKETLGSAYADLQVRIDQIVEQAQQQGSLNVAISGLNSIRQTLDSLARLAGHLQPASTHRACGRCPAAMTRFAGSPWTPGSWPMRLRACRHSSSLPCGQCALAARKLD